MPFRARELECQTIQIFSRNPRGWKYSPLRKNEIEQVRKDIESFKIDPLFIHMPYLPNPASLDKSIYKRSIDSMIEEVKRAESLKAGYVNVHIGKKMDAGLEQGLKRVIQALNTVMDRTKNSFVTLLVENTAGQGSEIGNLFEHIGFIKAGIENKNRFSVCLDTAHLFAAGYDLRARDSIRKTFQEFERYIGWEYLKCIHYNDSKSHLGSRVDRHDHIGKGKIGQEGMKNIMTYKKLSHLPFILETPKDTDQDDRMNLETVKSFQNASLWE